MASRPQSNDGAKPQVMASEILDKAADLIAPDGAWIQGDWWGVQDDDVTMYPDRADCWCAEGALCLAARMDYGAEIAEHPASLFLVRSLGLDSPHGLPSWNDDPRHTKAEVIAAFRKAADLARSEGQ